MDSNKAVEEKRKDFTQGKEPPSPQTQFSRGRKPSQEEAFEDDSIENEDDLKSGIIKRRMTLPASTSVFRKTLSQEAKMGDAAAEELEKRLKNLVVAFSTRTRRTKEKVEKPPTPTTSDSEDDLPAEEDNLLFRLRQLCSPSGDSEAEGENRRRSLVEKLRKNVMNKFHAVMNFLTCHYVLDADGLPYISWLVVVAACFLYNALVIPLRAVFPYQTTENVHIWQYFDLVADLVYFIDIVAFKSHRKFLREGFWIKDPIQTRKSYIETLQFKIDLMSLFPADIITTLSYKNYPLLRIPRLLKIQSYWELFQRFDTILASPHSARITKTFIYMIYMIHLNACVYYGISQYEGLGTTKWTFSGIGNAYIRCFYFSTKTATSIGKIPRPENELEYIYMTFAWLSGVFVTAILIGQFRDIIATATKNQNEYRATTYAAISYLHRLGVPRQLEEKVKIWLSYTWEKQKTLDESKILDLLPDKMRTDVALDLHVETLSKVKLFHHCEVSFLRDLVCKLKSTIFLPGDYICKKGEVGREMFIIQSGKIHVIGGAGGNQILVTLGEGSVFGEIALLGIGGMNKRTADVRAAGFANLFVLHKDGLEEAIRDYPASQEIIRKKAKKLLKENIKKAKEAAAKESEKVLSSPDSAFILGDAVIIKTKEEEPKLIETLKKIFPPESKMGKYLSRGSKGTTELEMDLVANYPNSSDHTNLELDISIMTGDHFEGETEIAYADETDSGTTTSTSSADEELRMYFGSNNNSKVDNERNNVFRCSTPLPPTSPSPETTFEEQVIKGPPSPLQIPPSQAIVPVARKASREETLLDMGDAFNTETAGPSSSLWAKGESRDVLPVGLRFPVYPIVGGLDVGVQLSSSEESETEESNKVKGEMTQKSAALIASRFLTAIKRRPLKRQHSVCVENVKKDGGNQETMLDSE